MFPCFVSRRQWYLVMAQQRREDEGRTKGVSRVNREGGNEGRVCVAFLIGFVWDKGNFCSLSSLPSNMWKNSECSRTQNCFVTFGFRFFQQLKHQSSQNENFHEFQITNQVAPLMRIQMAILWSSTKSKFKKLKIAPPQLQNWKETILKNCLCGTHCRRNKRRVQLIFYKYFKAQLQLHITPSTDSLLTHQLDLFIH